MDQQVSFEQVRPIEGTQQTGFEKLCCQLARDCAKPDDSSAKFFAKGDPDGGVECYWKLSNGDEIGWQAKYHTSSPGDSLWGNLDRSVERALDKHPDLCKYIVCVPLDRKDPRKEKEEWFMDRWNQHVKKWNSWDPSVEFDYWGNFELQRFLSREPQRGMRYYWFNQEALTDEKIKQFAEEQVSNADIGYEASPGVSLPVREVFDGLGRTGKLKKDIEETHDNIERSVTRLQNSENSQLAEISHITTKIRELSRLINSSKDRDNPIPTSEGSELLDDILDEIDQILFDSISETEDSVENSTQDDLQSVRTTLGRVRSFLNRSKQKLANQPRLYVQGEAGIGKTHLFCDIVTDWASSERPALLFLGKHFHNGDIWQQMIDRIGLDCQPDEFLGALNSFGRVKEERTLILVDALNESEPRSIWMNQLNGLLRKISRYQHVGIALSCRTGYEQGTVPQFNSQVEPIQIRHDGFRDSVQSAAKEFFEFYGLESGSVPLLQPEFENPLFLKLFCETLRRQGRTRIPHGSVGITKLFESYTDSVNEDISAQINYDADENLVSDAIRELASKMAAEGKKTLPKKKAKDCVNDLLPNRRYRDSLYYGILREDVISEQESLQNEKYVRFRFEMFADYYIVEQILSDNVGKDVVESFHDSRKLSDYFIDSSDSGLLETLSIQLPEDYGCEIFEILEGELVLEAFIRGLSWRNPDTLVEDESVKTAIEDYLFENLTSHTQDQLFETLVLLAGSEGHPMNATYLDGLLREMDISSRDQYWSTFLHQGYEETTVDRLISWGEKVDSQDMMTEQQRKSYGTVLAWCFTTSSRPVRDKATKAMVNLFDENLREILPILTQFEDIDDPYITERIYAATYGIVLRNPLSKATEEIAEYIYEREFADKKPIPHILARDYAQGVVHAVVNHQSDFEVPVQNIQPPYDQKWPHRPPTKVELNTLRKTLLENANSEAATQQVNNVWSALVGKNSDEHGWSDFSRYIVGTNHGSEFQHFNLQMLDGLRWIVMRMTEIGWKPNTSGDVDERIKNPPGRRENAVTETLRKKYQWIAYRELVSYLCDMLPKTDENGDLLFEGTWHFEYNRDIDPSMVLPDRDGIEGDRYNPLEYDGKISEMDAEEWITDTEEYPDIEPLLRVSAGGTEWTPLYQYLRSNTESGDRDIPKRRFFLHAYGHIVDKSDLDGLISHIEDNWVSKEELSLSDIRDLPQISNAFIGEYPWHPSCEYESRVIDNSPVPAERTATKQLFEYEYDGSTSGTYSRLAPSRSMYERYDLTWDFQKLEFVSEHSGLRIFDPSFDPSESAHVDQNGPDSLLATRKPLSKELNGNDDTILWIILGEKNTLEDPPNEDIGYLRLRGVYWLANGDITGKASAEYVEPGERPTGKRNYSPNRQETTSYGLSARFEDIDGISTEIANTLREHGYEDIQDLYNLKEEDLQSIQGIGPILSKRLRSKLQMYILANGIDKNTDEESEN